MIWGNLSEISVKYLKFEKEVCRETPTSVKRKWKEMQCCWNNKPIDFGVTKSGFYDIVTKADLLDLQKFLLYFLY